MPYWGWIFWRQTGACWIWQNTNYVSQVEECLFLSRTLHQIPPDLIQARVTLQETVRILPFSVMETLAKVNGRVRGLTWLLQECKSKQLPVRVANGLVSTTCTQVLVRLLNPSLDLRVVYKGTKVATMEEIEEKPLAPVQAVQAEVMEVSYA